MFLGLRFASEVEARINKFDPPTVCRDDCAIILHAVKNLSFVVRKKSCQMLLLLVGQLLYFLKS